MEKNSKWLIMTYYCPTHGSLDRSQPLELTKTEIKEAKQNFNKNNKLWN